MNDISISNINLNSTNSANHSETNISNNFNDLINDSQEHTESDLMTSNDLNQKNLFPKNSIEVVSNENNDKKKQVSTFSASIPDHILNNKSLQDYIKKIPSNYNFEIEKTVWRIQESNAKCVALQMPEGLTMFATMLADIFREFCKVEVIIMGDVTYGACCVDDYIASSLGADLMVHYAHSCLIPISSCKMNVLYVFVDIQIDLQHLIDTLKHNIPKDYKLALVSTIQFVSSLRAAKHDIQNYFAEAFIPQAMPLSPGEILGCTSPQLDKLFDCIVYVGDGRFHLESIMIHNPEILAYKYDPYNKKFTIEKYDHLQMRQIRKEAIETSQTLSSYGGKWGIILGALGRQGSPRILHHLENLLQERKIPYVVVLLSEIFPSKLSMFKDVNIWVQIACPRLSIDWGYAFDRPLLSPYEAEVALKSTTWKDVYPMDFYSRNGGSWSVYHDIKKKEKSQEERALAKQKLKERMKLMKKKKKEI